MVILLLKMRFQKILHHRYKRYHIGEIDIISQRGNALFFIEVKTSVARCFSTIQFSVQQRRSIIRAAKYFLACNPKFLDFEINFEIYYVSAKSGIKRIKNAWDASGR